jgi:hypothetical protein
VRVDTGAFHEAEELLRGGIADKPSLADAHYWLAISLAGLNRWDEATEEAGLAVQLAADNEHYRKVYDLFHETGGKDLVIKLDDRSVFRERQRTKTSSARLAPRSSSE